MTCRSGCTSGPHASYGECLRAASIRVAYCNSAGRSDYTTQKKWDRELADYRDAVKQGIEPAGTDRRSIEHAVRVSNETGVAFKA